MNAPLPPSALPAAVRLTSLSHGGGCGCKAVCSEAGIPVAGGHSIDSVEAIYGLVALGWLHPKRVKRNADAQVGVGVLSAALKKDQLSADGYAQMIACTTPLNTPGPDLAALAGVHALTEVTGFGLAGGLVS